MTLSINLKHKIAFVLAYAHTHNVFEYGSYYTNGKRLVYLSYEVYGYDLMFDTDGIKVESHELVGYVDIRNLLPNADRYKAEFEIVFSRYKQEFMLVHNITGNDFEQKFLESDVLKWFLGKQPQEIQINTLQSMSWIRSTLLDIDEVINSAPVKVLATSSR